MKLKRRKNLRQALLSQESRDFIVERLGKEWDELQRAAKHEEIIRRAKTAGFTMAKTILILAAIAGGITVAIVAPNIFGAMGRLSGRRGFFSKKEFQHSLRYLKKRKYVEVIKGSDEYEIELTDNGARVLFAESFRKLEIRPQSSWDGIWHIVSFDIPNKYKWAREAFRERLKAMGLYPMQESVFIYPYPLDREIRFLTSLLSISDFVRVIKSNNVSSDRDIRDYFSL